MAITEGSTIEADGLEFGYVECGEGPLALCLHGFADSPWTWRDLLPALADRGFRAVAPFLPGYAPSSIPADGLYQVGAIATHLNALHGALGGDGDAVLVGHDWGAIVAYPMAATAPERWRRVVTLAVPPPLTVVNGFFTFDQLKRSWYTFLFQSPMAEIAVPLDDLAFLDRLWTDWSPGYDAAADIPRAKACVRDPANLLAALGYYRALIGDGPKSPAYTDADTAAFAVQTQPWLYLHGADDGCMGAGLIDDAVLSWLAAPGSRFEVIEGCGHFLHLERPDLVIPSIVEFLIG